MNREKYTLILIFIVTFSLFLVIINFLAVSEVETEEWGHYVDGRGIISFYVRSTTSGESSRNAHSLEPYMIRWLEIEGIYYLMLPNSADATWLTVYFQASAPVFIGSYQLISGDYTDIFANRDGESVILSSDGYYYEVIVMESSEIATMFIQTESGNLDDVHERRRHRETAWILMICADGETILYDGKADRFNGRGNATWNRDKRPYNIRLTESTDLLGLGDAQHRHWALLAEHFDDSRLRNTISHHLAQEVGLEAAVRVRPVDVYINNEYMGLYLLTERVRIDTILPITDLEAATSRLNQGRLSEFPHVGDMEFAPNARKYFNIPHNPPDITGGYLLEWQLSRRYRRNPSAFATSRGQAVMLRAPSYASFEQMEYISHLIQNMEDAVYSPTGYNALGRHFTDYLDIQSFAMMYVFQEFTMNLDAGITSFFVYKESDLASDGLLRAAPPWDFDNTFGRFGHRDGIDLRNPELFWVNQGMIFENDDDVPHIFTALWKHEQFRELSMELWHNYFAPVVERLIDNSVETRILSSVYEYTDVIRDSLEMEWVRWEMEVYHQETTDFLIDFITRRIRFLNEEWD